MSNCLIHWIFHWIFTISVFLTTKYNLKYNQIKVMKCYIYYLYFWSNLNKEVSEKTIKLSLYFERFVSMFMTFQQYLVHPFFIALFQGLGLKWV